MQTRFLVFVLTLTGLLRGADLAFLEAQSRRALSDWNTPGLAIAVVQNDRVIFARGFGVRELNRPEPVTEHTLFAIASNTKAFTAGAIAMLAQRQKLAWDDRVQTHLPWFQVFNDPWISHEARLDDLLCHRLGFRTFSGDLLWWGTPYTSRQVVERARYLPAKFGFRHGYGYSNIAFIAAGEVIAQVAQTSYADFIRAEILAPLGMKDTVVGVRELAGRPDVATPHGADDDGRPFSIAWQGWDNCLAAGGIISSAADLAQWLRLQLNEGKRDGRTYWTAKETWRMWSMHNPTEFGPDTIAKDPSLLLRGAGLGWFLSDYRGELVVRHGGAYDGMFSQTVLVPRRKLGVVVLTNGMTGLPGTLASQVLDHLLGIKGRDWPAENLKRAAEARAKKAKARQQEGDRRLPNTTPSRPLEAYAGRYGGPMYGDANVAWENGRLVLRLEPNPELSGDLVHWQHDIFVIKWHRKFAFFGEGKVQFLLDRESRPVEFRMDVPNEDFWFEELEFKRK